MSDNSPYNNHFYSNLLNNLVAGDYAAFDELDDNESYLRPAILGEGTIENDAAEFVYILREPGATKPTRLFVSYEQMRAIQTAPPPWECH